MKRARAPRAHAFPCPANILRLRSDLVPRLDPEDTIAPPPPRAGLKYRRIVLKLSGEALCGEEGGFGIRPDTLQKVAAELAEVQRMGVQIGIEE